MKWFFLSLLILIAAAYIFIQTPLGQNWIGRLVTKRLSRDLHTKVTVKHIDFSLFNRMHLEGLMVEDRKGDTLLYAGDMKLKITDWFFFKKDADLKYIGLDRALIKFQRTDSVWSQQFLFDYFSSSPSSGKKKKSGLQLHIKKIELRNITFIKKDAWEGNDMTLHVNSLGLDANEIDFDKKILDLRTLTLDRPLVMLSSYPRSKPRLEGKNTNSPAGVDSLLQWNQAGWIMHLGDLKIRKGILQIDKQSDQPILASFDGRHISFEDINADLTEVNWDKDTISTRLDLKTKERSGLEVKKLLADIRFTPREMAFDNLEIRTNNSIIRNYYRMGYNDFSDMDDFIHSVSLQGNFDNSEIDSDDIAYFAPALKTWKKKITLQGNVRGTVDALIGRNIIVQAGKNTLLNGDISLSGLPDINRTFIDFTANDFRTTYGDAITFAPVLRHVTNPDLKKIQYLNFKGSFTGFIRDFVTFGTIQTNLGTAKTDLNMKLPRGQDPIYSGKISTDNFNLGEFLNDKDIGFVSFEATVKGTGFSTQTWNTLVDGTVQFADYKNYRYKNISAKGKLVKELFEGLASIRDENVDLDMNGVIDLNRENPLFNLKAKVVKANLKNLNLTREDYTFKGNFDLNFNGSTLDNFLGVAKVTQAEITRNGNRLPFDSLVLSSTYADNEKKLNIVSNELTAEIIGNFSLKDIPNAFTFILNKYYPAYIKAPAKLPENENIRFDIAVYNADEYLKLIDSSLSGFNYSRYTGNLDLAKNELTFRAVIPQFKFKQYTFDSLVINASGKNDRLTLTTNAQKININDSLNITMAVVNIDAHNDSSRISINTGANETVEKASINALLLTYTDGVKIEFDPSNFSINGKTWTIDETGELEFRSTNPASGKLVLQEGDQKILLQTQPSSAGNWNNLKIELTRVNLGDISPYLLPKNRLEGLVSGTIMATDPLHNLVMTSDSIQTKFLRLDNDSLGELTTTMKYDNKTRELHIKGNTVDQLNYLGFEGTIFIGDPAKAINNHIVLKAKNYQIKVLERFLGDLFSDFRGTLTGDVNLDGAFNNLAVSGTGLLKNAGLKVNFTQCFYWIQDTPFELTASEIKLDGLVLKDSITGHNLYVKGNIEHESFKNMFYDIYISTRKPGTTGDNNNLPVQLIKTTYKDNKDFYGNVKGTGSLSLAGPQSDMFMKIDAFASTRDSSNLTIPPTTSRESGIADFLVERKFGREMTVANFNRNVTNIIYDVDVTANPRLNVKVELDELTGDVIKGKGNGTLKLRSGSSEPLSLRGRFDIDEGDYLFTFQSFFKKPFVLKKGTDNFIEWNGDPYDARINLTATYTANNVSYAPLASYWTNIDQKISNARSDVYVVAKLTEKLFSPQINFSLEFPTSSVAIDDPALAFSLQQLQKNLAEMNKQATYLVVFGIFAPVENSGSINTFQEIATNSLSGIFFNVINDQVKKIVSNIFKTEKWNFNFSSSVYNRNVFDPNRNVIDPSGNKFSLGSNVNASLGRSLFNNKVIFSLGGSVEGLLQSGSIQQNVQWFPNATLEILLNESGTFRINLFYRQNIDYLTTSSSGAGRTKEAGLGFSYRKEADTIWELLFKKKKKTAPPQPVENTDVRKEEEQQ